MNRGLANYCKAQSDGPLHCISASRDTRGGGTGPRQQSSGHASLGLDQSEGRKPSHGCKNTYRGRVATDVLPSAGTLTGTNGVDWSIGADRGLMQMGDGARIAVIRSVSVPVRTATHQSCMGLLPTMMGVGGGTGWPSESSERERDGCGVNGSGR